MQIRPPSVTAFDSERAKGGSGSCRQPPGGAGGLIGDRTLKAVYLQPPERAGRSPSHLRPPKPGIDGPRPVSSISTTAPRPIANGTATAVRLREIMARTGEAIVSYG